MKNFLRNIFNFGIVFAVLGAGIPAFGQTAQCSTTLAAAITTTSQTGISLTSASCLSSTGPQSLNQSIYVDNELIYVRQQASNPTTFISTTRGASGTRSVIHASGATVYIGPSYAFSTLPVSAAGHSLVGGCVSTAELYLPAIVANADPAVSGIYDCRGGTTAAPVQWIKLANGTQDVAGNAITTFCTGTVGSAETEFLNGVACSGATTSTFKYTVGFAGTIAQFRASSSANFLGTGGSTFTVLKNGSATAIVCAPTAGQKVCVDSTHSVPVAAGDVITISFLTATSDTAANLSINLGLY